MIPRIHGVLVDWRATLLVLALVVGPHALRAESVFRAGAATSNITPHLGGSINGSMQDRHSTHIHDELHARCLALDDGVTTLVLVIVDSCAVSREVFDRAKELVRAATGLAPENMMMSATHTHSAATAVHVFQSAPDPAYQEFLGQRIADGVRRALNQLEPAKIAWGVGHEPQHVFNRRWWVKPEALPPNPFGAVDQVRMNPPGGDVLVKPAGPTDPDVTVISVVAKDGRPIAVYANYSLHYVGGVPPTHISADYYGAFAENLQRRLRRVAQDPPLVVMMTNGTSGNINNVNFTAPRPRLPPYTQIEKVADDVAKTVQAVVETLTYRDSASLATRQSELALRVRKPNRDALTRAEGLLAQAQPGAELTRDQIYARETLLLSKYPDEVPLILQAMRIGDLALASVPCEVFVEIGLDLKMRSPLKTVFTVSLANGYNGYLPTAQHHAWGGYETWAARSSYLEIDAAAKITDRLIEHLGELEQLGQLGVRDAKSLSSRTGLR